MTTHHDDMRVPPDPSRAEELRRLLHARLASGSRNEAVVPIRDAPLSMPSVDPNPDHQEGDLIMLDSEARPTGDQPAMARRRSPGRWLLVAAAAVVLAVVGTLFVVAGGDDDDTQIDTVTSPTSDISPTTLAKGEDVDFVGSSALGQQTMDISAQEQDGEVTGVVSFEPHGSVASFRCADTTADGVILIGGEFTTVRDDGDEAVGQWITVVIRAGDPDSAFVWFAELGTEAPSSCAEALKQVPEPGSTSDAQLIDVEDGDDIETG